MDRTVPDADPVQTREWLDSLEGVIEVDGHTHRIVGCDIVGPNAGDLIAEAAFAIELEADAADSGMTIHPHPARSGTVSMATEVFEGTITDLIAPKKR